MSASKSALANAAGDIICYSGAYKQLLLRTLHVSQQESSRHSSRRHHLLWGGDKQLLQRAAHLHILGPLDTRLVQAHVDWVGTQLLVVSPHVYYAGQDAPGVEACCSYVQVQLACRHIGAHSCCVSSCAGCRSATAASARVSHQTIGPGVCRGASNCLSCSARLAQQGWKQCCMICDRQLAASAARTRPS